MPTKPIVNCPFGVYPKWTSGYSVKTRQIRVFLNLLTLTLQGNRFCPDTSMAGQRVGYVRVIASPYISDPVKEAARGNDITQSEIEKWMDDAEAGMENTLEANATKSR